MKTKVYKVESQGPIKKAAPKKESVKFVLLTGAAIDTMTGVFREYIQNADDHVVLLTKDEATAKKIQEEIKTELSLGPDPISQAHKRFEKKYKVKLLVYPASRATKIEKLIGVQRINEDDINAISNVEDLRRLLGANYNKMWQGKRGFPNTLNDPEAEDDVPIISRDERGRG